MTKILGLIFLLLNLHAQEDVPKNLMEVGLNIIKINEEQILAVNFKNHPGWHTYWINPGDAGLPIKVQFLNNNKDLNLSLIEWPRPKRFIENGEQWAFGYENAYSLFFKFKKNLIEKPIEFKAQWLICKHICVPGKIDGQLKISQSGSVTTSSNLQLNVDSNELESRFNALPKMGRWPSYLELNLNKGAEENTLTLDATVKSNTNLEADLKENLIYYYPKSPFDFEHEKIGIKNQSIVTQTKVLWDGEYSEPKEPLNSNGKFKKPHKLKFLFLDPISKNYYILEKSFNQYNLSPQLFTSDVEVQKKNEVAVSLKPDTSHYSANESLFYYLILALFGGFILNFMPCVLPVISLKLFGLIKIQNESKTKIIRHNLFYTLGILFTFFLLSIAILIFKQTGNVIGWGFQLQSPMFVAIMIIVLFVFTLNLFGLFEFQTPGGKYLGQVDTKDNFLGDFLSGIMATILSTPCSAPFLGTALTFAFTSSTATIILVFQMIGIGLALPFILTAIFPKIVYLFPKPGNWMNLLKKFLGLTLVLTLIWLLDVYNDLVGGQNHFIKILTILVILFFSFYLNRKQKFLKPILWLCSLLIFVNLSTTPIIDLNIEETSLIKDKKSKGLNWNPWSLEKMQQLQNQKQITFIDFTAKWCFTCKVNEKVVLDTVGFKNLVDKHNIQLLIGDWTKRDEKIGKFLESHKLVGVPAYFIINKNGELKFIGETLTLSKIEKEIIQ